MKKTLPYLLLFILAILIFNGLFGHADMHFAMDDGDFDSPLGTVFGTVLAGGGILIGALVMILVAVVLAVVFAGVTVVGIAAIVLAALVAIIAISPLLLPVVIPCVIVWYMARRKPAAHDLKESTV
ncbi:MAG TPA: hypothetical protein VGC21_01480 [Telluria sp.]|jgi:uncharacterized membrane protein